MTSHSLATLIKIWTLGAIALLLFVSSSSFARELGCSDIFQNSARLSDQVKETIRQLAQLRLRVDLAQADGGSALLMKKLRADFERKKRELVLFVENQQVMTRAELAVKIRQQIAELQRLASATDSNIRDEENRRERQRSEVRDLVVDGRRAIFHRVEPATFVVGIANDHRTATIERHFEMMATSVTQIIWKKIAELANRRLLPGKSILPIDPSRNKGDLRPVEKVSLGLTKAWIEALNELSANGEPRLGEIIAGHKTGDVYRLPTGDEWELVVRGGGGSVYSNDEHFFEHFPWGADYSWTLENSGMETHPVAEKKPIVIGRGLEFFDMIGNVEQWVQSPQILSRSQKAFMREDFGFARGAGFVHLIRDQDKGSWTMIGPGWVAEYNGFRLVRVVRSSED
jgi:hypothetical protein